MEYEIIMQYIKPELLVLIPVLNILGVFLKKAESIKDKNIPLTLGGVGIVLSLCYVLSFSEIISVSDVFGAIFTAIIQGVFIACVAVYGHQVYKQSTQGD